MRKNKEKANKSKSSCCVPQCTTPGYIVTNEGKVTFHSMAKDKERLKTWLVKIRRDIGQDFKVTDHTKICSRHFIPEDFSITEKGRRFLRSKAVPSKFSWNIKQNTRRVLNRTKDEQMETDQEMSEIGPRTEVNELRSRIDALEEELKFQKDAAELFQKERDHLKTIVKKQKPGAQSFSLAAVAHSNELICFYTGFPTYTTMMACFKYLDTGKRGENIRYYNSKENSRRVVCARKLTTEDEYFMTLVRLRLGLFETDLAMRFDVSRSTVHRICITWINYMYLRLGSVNIWPSQEVIRRTMPESMKEKYPKVEWLIDAFEIQCQRPSSLQLQSQSYSNYKSRNTVKGLLACIPSGQVGFISQLYTGNISDRELTERSGFLRMPHNKGAMWLADKGFRIDDLAKPLGCSVNIPAFVGQNQQMSPEEVFHTQQIASERIHIERAINKVKKLPYL